MGIKRTVSEIVERNMVQTIRGEAFAAWSYIRTVDDYLTDHLMEEGMKENILFMMEKTSKQLVEAIEAFRIYCVE